MTDRRNKCSQVPFGIGGGHLGGCGRPARRMPAPFCRRTWLEQPRMTGLHGPGCSAVAADRCGPLLGKLPAGKAAKRHRYQVWIAVVTDVVDESAGERFGHEVIMVGASWNDLGYLQQVEDVEGFIANLVVRGDVRVVLVGGWRLGHYLGPVALKIRRCQNPSSRMDGLTNAFGNLAGVKSGGTMLRDLPQGLGQRCGIKTVLRAPVISGTRRVAVSGQEERSGRQLPNGFQPPAERGAKAPGHVESAVGDLDCRSQELRPWQPTGCLVGLPEPRDRPWDGNRNGAYPVPSAFDPRPVVLPSPVVLHPTANVHA